MKPGEVHGVAAVLKRFRLSFLLAALALLIAGGVPSIAHAQSAATQDTATTQPCDPSKPWMQAYSQNAAATAQAKAAAINRIFTGVPDIDVRLNYCMDTIKAMFDINAALSNPLGIIQNIVRQQILNLANQACAAAISAVSQVVAFGLSQFNRFCVPLPSLNLNLNANLGLKNVPCNGVNLLNPKFTTGTPPSAPGSWNIWGAKNP